VPIDAIELQLAAAMQRYHALQRRAETHHDSSSILAKAFAELDTAFEALRVAQEQLIENRARMERLQSDLQRQSERYWQLFDEMPDAYVVTKDSTAIVDVNKAAARLFNVSQRFLVGKTLSVFVCEDRAQFLGTAARLANEGGLHEMIVKLRPRERAPLAVRARVTGDREGLRWVFQPAAPATQEPEL